MKSSTMMMQLLIKQQEMKEISDELLAEPTIEAASVCVCVCVLSARLILSPRDSPQASQYLADPSYHRQSWRCI